MTSPPRPTCASPGSEFRHHAVGDVGELEAIGIDAGQADDQHRPDRGAADHARDAGGAGAPDARQHEPENQRRTEGRARETGVVETEERRARGDDEERRQRGGQNRQREDQRHG